MDTNKHATVRETLPKAGLPFMEGPTHRLARIGSTFYVRSRFRSISEPREYVNYYRVRSVAPNPYGPMPDLDEAAAAFAPLDSTGTTYVLRMRSMWCYLCIAPSDLADYVDDYDVPAPKVRKGIELRWNGLHGGRWEKLLRTGWVPA